MKYLILLILLMNIMVFSRKHLSRKSRRTHGKDYVITIATLDEDPRFQKKLIYHGHAEVELPTNDEQLEIKIIVKNAQDQNLEDDSADIAKVERTDGVIQKLPFFQLVSEGYVLIIRRWLCKGEICYVRYGSDFVPVILKISSVQDSKIILNNDKIRDSYYNILRKEINEEDKNSNKKLGIGKEDSDQIEKDYGMKKQELACMQAIRQGKISYDMKDLYDQREGIDLLLNEDLLSNFDDTVEKKDAIESIQKLAKECMDRWDTFMSPREVKIIGGGGKFLIDLGERMFETILAHLGVAGKKYEFYGAIVSEFLYTYKKIGFILLNSLKLYRMRNIKRC
jgi:cellulose synthase/poly-beta-1,6-N-acetylglucosamine synthase-like glycosyltransferase